MFDDQMARAALHVSFKAAVHIDQNPCAVDPPKARSCKVHPALVRADASARRHPTNTSSKVTAPQVVHCKGHSVSTRLSSSRASFTMKGTNVS